MLVTAVATVNKVAVIGHRFLQHPIAAGKSAQPFPPAMHISLLVDNLPIRIIHVDSSGCKSLRITKLEKVEEDPALRTTIHLPCEDSWLFHRL